MGASVSFSFAMVMALEKRDLCVAVNETFKDLDTRSLDDAFGNLPLHVQQQVIVGMLVWIAASAVRIERKVDHLGTLVDGLEEAVEDLAIGIRGLVCW
jgi:hypothetical protein